jgi:cysteine desulfurase
MAGVGAETQVIAFDLAGIAVSAGAACTSGKVARSHVLDAMGVTVEQARYAIRVSLGWGTTASDVDRFVAAWAELYQRNRGATRVA